MDDDDDDADQNNDDEEENDDDVPQRTSELRNPEKSEKSEK